MGEIAVDWELSAAGVGCASDATPDVCSSSPFDESESFGTGRRIYIQEASLAGLAGQSVEAARRVYGMIACIVVTKALHHNLEQDLVNLNLIEPGQADQVVASFRQSWPFDISDSLRRIGQVSRESRNRPAPFEPVLKANESVHSSCYFSNYFTFATNAATACLMYADTNDIATIKRKMLEGSGYGDLKLINGNSLFLITPALQRSGLCPPRVRQSNLTDQKLQEVRVEVFQAVADRLDNSLHGLSRTLGPHADFATSQIRSALSVAFSKGLLKIPDSARHL